MPYTLEFSHPGIDEPVRIDGYDDYEEAVRQAASMSSCQTYLGSIIHEPFDPALLVPTTVKVFDGDNELCSYTNGWSR